MEQLQKKITENPSLWGSSSALLGHQMAPQSSGWKVPFLSINISNLSDWMLGITTDSPKLWYSPNKSPSFMTSPHFSTVSMGANCCLKLLSYHSSGLAAAEHHQQIPRGQRRAAVKTCQRLSIMGYSKAFHGIIIRDIHNHHRNTIVI